MYLKDHYVVLNRGEGNFGIHSGAVLLDPGKTFGSNVILEIYNRSNQPVINPDVSIEVHNSPKFDQKQALSKQSQTFFLNLDRVYQQLDDNPKAHFSRVRPTTSISVSGASALCENQSLLIRIEGNISKEIKRIGSKDHFGFRTVNQAIRKGDASADTLVMDTFPSLLEHIEILTRVQNCLLSESCFEKRPPCWTFSCLATPTANSKPTSNSESRSTGSMP